MTATIDDAVADDTHAADTPQAPEPSGTFGEPQPPGRAVIAIELLTAHPGNVRRDVSLDQEFLDSIAELGETWRTDRPYPRCPRDDAGAYFRFLHSAGYELSPIEQAVASGVPYTGDQPTDELTSADDQHNNENVETTGGDQTIRDVPAEGSPDDIEAQATIL